MSKKHSVPLSAILVFALLALLVLAGPTSGILLAAPQAIAEVIGFRDTYSRADGSPPEDSLGTTEDNHDVAILDYRELGGCCGTPTVSNVAWIEGGSLFVRGSGTEPAWVELDNAGLDFDLNVEAEFLATNVSGNAAANDLNFLFRNAGRGADGTIFTPGVVDFEFEVNGLFVVRGIMSGMSSMPILAIGYVDADAFAKSDLDQDGLLETGEPFTVRLILQGDTFSFDFNGIRQVSNLDFSSLPDLPDGGDRLLFGRNRRAFTSTPLGIRLDNLESNGVTTVEIDIKPGSDPSCLNNDGNGVIPVAILGSAEFDVQQIDVATVALEGMVVAVRGKAERYLSAYEDVNGDGFTDLVVKIEDVDGTLTQGSGSATLTGKLQDGTPFAGTDDICIVQ